MEDRLQERRRRGTPCAQHALLVLSQAVITMCSGVLEQSPAKLDQRLYDVIRELVSIHVASPDPPLL